MSRLRMSRSVSPRQARVLSTATALIAVVCGLTAVVPFSPTAPRATAAVLTVVGFAVAGLLHWQAHRLTTGHVHALIVTVTTVMSWCVAQSTTPTGAVVTAVSLFWVAMFVAVFQTRPAMVVHLVLLAAGLAVGLHAASPPSLWQTWLFLTGTIAGVAWVLHGKVTALRQDATRDELTGVLTRRAFIDVARGEVSWSRRSGRPVTIAVIDLDGFKAINDRHGHAAGDAVLAGLPVAWRDVLRPRDALGRLGGDEFALLMPETDEAGARVVIERMRATSTTFTFSAGVAAWSDRQDIEAWVALADARQYEDKRSRRAADDDVRS